MLGTLGKLLIELRDDPVASAIHHGRVRPFEPAPGDAMGKGEYLAFVVIVQLASPRVRRVGAQQPRFAVRCYGRTLVEADELFRACSDAIHDTGPRLHANGLGIYASHDDSGGSAGRDPDTGQPHMDFVVELLATTQAVTV